MTQIQLVSRANFQNPQESLDYRQVVTHCEKLSPKFIKVLNYFLKWNHKYQGKLYLSKLKAAKLLGMDEKTVRRALNYFWSIGWVKWYRPAGFNTTCVYTWSSIFTKRSMQDQLSKFLSCFRFLSCKHLLSWLRTDHTPGAAPDQSKITNVRLYDVNLKYIYLNSSNETNIYQRTISKSQSSRERESERERDFHKKFTWRQSLRNFCGGIGFFNTNPKKDMKHIPELSEVKGDELTFDQMKLILQHAHEEGDRYTAQLVTQLMVKEAKKRHNNGQIDATSYGNSEDVLSHNKQQDQSEGRFIVGLDLRSGDCNPDVEFIQACSQYVETSRQYKKESLSAEHEKEVQDTRDPVSFDFVGLFPCPFGDPK